MTDRDRKILDFLRQQAEALRRRPEGYTDGDSSAFEEAIERFAELAEGLTIMTRGST
jgi:hypothetical protein